MEKFMNVLEWLKTYVILYLFLMSPVIGLTVGISIDNLIVNDDSWFPSGYWKWFFIVAILCFVIGAYTAYRNEWITDVEHENDDYHE